MEDCTAVNVRRVATIDIPGVRYAYDEAGHGSPLLLLHAGITDRRMWDDVLPALANRHRVVRPDLRGFGETPLPAGTFSHAGDVGGLLAALDITRTSVCGVSLGAGIALDLALSRPDLVERLVLVGPGLPGWAWSPAMEEFDSAEEAGLAAGDLDGASWLNVRFWLDGPRRAEDQVDPLLRQRVYEMQRRAFENDNPDAEAAWLVPDRQDRLADLTMPTLIVVGELDQPDVVGIARHVAERVPNCRLEVLPGAAHLPPMEVPDLFVGVLLEHLGGDWS